MLRLITKLTPLNSDLYRLLTTSVLAQLQRVDPCLSTCPTKSQDMTVGIQLKFLVRCSLAKYKILT